MFSIFKTKLFLLVLKRCIGAMGWCKRSMWVGPLHHFSRSFFVIAHSSTAIFKICALQHQILSIRSISGENNETL